MEVAIEPRSNEDRAKLDAALQTLAGDDPRFAFGVDAESGLTLLKGPDEVHLSAAVDLLRDQHGIEADVGAPQVAYRETITRRAEVEHTYSQVTGSTSHFARVKLVFEPSGPGSGFAFENATVDNAVPETFLPGVCKGLEAAKELGLLAGFPLVDFKATLVGGAHHDIDSSPWAFEMASRAAFRALHDKGGVALLEPVMDVEVVFPEDCLGDVVGDLQSRRGEIRSRETRDDLEVILAFAPLSNLFGYGVILSLFSQGRASFTMRFSHYAAVPLPEPNPPTFSPAIGMRV